MPRKTVPLDPCHREEYPVGGLKVWRVRTAVVVALLLLVTAGLAAEATAQTAAGRTLTILAALCPVSYAGDASADECDGNPMAGVQFQVGQPFTDAFSGFVPTDVEGVVSFDINGLSLNGSLRIVESRPAGMERVVAYCVDAAGDPLSISYAGYSESNPSLGLVDVAVGGVGDVFCNWYNAPSTGTSEGLDPVYDNGSGLEVYEFRVDGEAMMPALEDQDQVLIDAAAYRFRAPQRGDIVVFAPPVSSTEKPYIKRIIGLPGEQVALRGGSVFTDGTQLIEPYTTGVTGCPHSGHCNMEVPPG